ncbi:SAP30-binding protein-like isoform X1 [Argiope bruennichi]|uniref:SAP30-binding protein like n=1 Tax=Argiope bruennichi TaxID=94029 RepID=A0A8T0E4D0_ARGBR|nr:SAP30-binding protein-like isoform X1 [Argiope bruennichi]XP_055946117.1 SAP30-binding protein-like isoform X1 [Argiope bruennichi]KAF8764310.1 SAP30-binding protein like [Argiope bruennichi]
MSTESRSQTALASLHETYTDSEGEAESDSEEIVHEKIVTPNKESSPSSMGSIPFFTYDSMKENKHHSKLVSYSTEAHEDEDMSDSDDSKSSSDPMEDSSSDNKVVPVGVPPLSPVSFHRKLLNLKKEEIQLPPEPVGRCSKSLQEKISELYEKKTQGKDMNASIQRRKDFRNPSIYEKLIQFCNIDEQGTNYPPETYDPHCWGPESFYDELAKRQKEEMDKREKEKKERTKVEFMSGTVKRPSSDSNSDPNKRKSKWDVGIAQMPASALKPASLVTPTVLPVATGTKPTVISAFGTITKKAK